MACPQPWARRASSRPASLASSPHTSPPPSPSYILTRWCCVLGPGPASSRPASLASSSHITATLALLYTDPLVLCPQPWAGQQSTRLTATLSSHITAALALLYTDPLVLCPQTWAGRASSQPASLPPSPHTSPPPSPSYIPTRWCCVLRPGPGAPAVTPPHRHPLLTHHRHPRPLIYRPAGVVSSNLGRARQQSPRLTATLSLHITAALALLYTDPLVLCPQPWAGQQSARLTATLSSHITAALALLYTDPLVLCPQTWAGRASSQPASLPPSPHTSPPPSPSYIPTRWCCVLRPGPGAPAVTPPHRHPLLTHHRRPRPLIYRPAGVVSSDLGRARQQSARLTATLSSHITAALALSAHQLLQIVVITLFALGRASRSPKPSAPTDLGGDAGGNGGHGAAYDILVEFVGMCMFRSHCWSRSGLSNLPVTVLFLTLQQFSGKCS